MRKLLSANLARLWKERVFWLAFAFMSIGTVCYGWIGFNENTKAQIYAEDVMFSMLPMMGFVFAFLISMRLGTEFDEHTIRNKLIVGYSRTQVYFAEYVTCMASSLIMVTAMLLSSGVFGYFLSREFLLGWQEITFLVFCCILMASVFSAMMVGICMNVHSKATSLVVSIVFMFAILLLASFCINALDEPQMTYDYVSITVDGTQFGDLVENPVYIDGVQRTIYEWIADILPTGQTIQLNNMECERAARWPVLSVIMLVVSTFAGYLPFRKRDIR